jgi:uncharacterized protein YjbI with pentapeptide repeats
MLIDSEEMNGAPGPLLEAMDGRIFRYCRFANFSIDGSGIEGALLWCAFEKVDWYWGLFNVATIAHSRFEDCVFRGTSFRGCEFVACSFTACSFELDNLDSACTFDDCSMVECTFERCSFATGRPDEPIFSNSRWYGCTQTQCVGLDGAF